MRDICINCKEEKYIHGRGLCNNCYQKLMKLKDFNELYPSKRKSKLKKCKVEGCMNNSRAKGYCQRHYNQIYKKGKILDINPNRSAFDKNEIRINNELNCAEIVIYNNKGYEKLVTYIDVEDIDKVKNIKWGSSGTYVSSSKYRLHRFLMDCYDDNLFVDHINHNTLDNRKCNLRICTPEENSKNLKLSKNNKTGVTGVYYISDKNVWRSGITVNNKYIHLGDFKDGKDAIKERLKAEVYYFKEFSPQQHLFEKYGIDINLEYKVKQWKPRKIGNEKGVRGIFKGSGSQKDKWKVEFKLNGKYIYLGHYNTLDEAVIAKENYIKKNI